MQQARPGRKQIHVDVSCSHVRPFAIPNEYQKNTKKKRILTFFIFEGYTRECPLWLEVFFVVVLYKYVV
jgi:hypothetical protein